jgi:hypothetical protein
MMTPGRPSPHVRLYAAILALAVLVRVHGITFGLPYPYEADEHVFVNIAARIVMDGDPNPRWFGHPGTTTIYALSGLYALLEQVGAVLGIWRGSDFQTFFQQNPTLIYLSGRLLMLALALSTIALAYFAFTRIFGRRTALLASLLLALSPLHVTYSRIIRTDVLSGLIILAVFWLCCDLLVRPRWRTYVLAGLLTGAGVATKYPTAIVGLVVLAAHFTNHRHRLSLIRPAVYGGSVLLGTFLASPFLFLDSSHALADILGESAPESTGTLLWETSQGWLADVLWYFGTPMVEAVSAIGIVLAGIGFLLVMKSRERNQMLVAGFAPVFIGLIALIGQRWARWVIPTLPFVCALTAYTIIRFVEEVSKRSGRRVAEIAGATLVLGLAGPLLVANIEEGRELRLPDTRTLAGEWVMTHVPARSNLLIEANTTFLPRDLYAPYVVTRTGTLVAAPEDTADAIRGPYRRNHVEQTLFRPFGHLGQLANITSITHNNIEYMVLGGAYDRYVARSGSDPACAVVAAKYDSLIAMGIKVAEFTRVPGKMRGPRVRVYRLSTPS